MISYNYYSEEQVQQVKTLSEQGVTQKEIERRTKIPRGTFRTWIKNGFQLHSRNKQRKFSKQVVEDAINKSYSFAGALRRLGISSNGSSGYNIIKKLIKQHNLNIDHFTGQVSNKGKTNPDRWRPIEDYLENKVRINSHSLREKLVQRDLKKAECEECGITEWRGQPAPLALHHIDKNHFNNNLSNLSILCENCHSLKHKNEAEKKRNNLIRAEVIPDSKFLEIIPTVYNARQLLIELGLTAYGANYIRVKNILFTYNLKFKEKPTKTLVNPNWRTDPKPDQRKVDRPPKEELEKLIYDMPMTLLGKKYGVSDNSIRKWCRVYQIELPNFPLGYWMSRQNGYSHEEAMNCRNKPKTNPPLLLTKDQVRIILNMKLKGSKQREIAKKLNLHYAKIGSVCRGESYKQYIKEIQEEMVSPQ